MLEPAIGQAALEVSPGVQWSLAAAVALLEVGAGVGLLLGRRSRRLSAFLLVGMHCAILALIGPIGHRWNVIVWPWNLTMILALGTFFIYRDAFEMGLPVLGASWWKDLRKRLAGSGTRRRAAIASSFVVLLFAVFPTLCLLDRWDAYLSFSLYTGNIRTFWISVAPGDIHRLPRGAQLAADGDGTVNMARWSRLEMGVDPYPEDRIAHSVAAALAETAREGPVYLKLIGKQKGWEGDRPTVYVRYPAGGGDPTMVEEEEFRLSR